MTTPHRKQARLLLILFLVLYAAFTLLPVGVWAVYRLGHSPDGAASSGETSSSSPDESSLPGTASQNEASALEEEEPLGSSPAPSSTTTPGFLEGREPTLSPTPTEGDVFTLYDTSTGETFDVTAEEFLPAALACEMDLSAPDEALKAQAVALYTFYSYQRSQNTGEGADFACDSANWLVYVPRSAMEERWGESFSATFEKLQSITSQVQGQLLTWEGEPICAAFFAISGGDTASSQEVWGQDFPYLQQVSSPGDCFASGYLSAVPLTATQLQEAAQAAWPGEVDFSGPEEEWIREICRGNSGYVTSAQVGGRTCTGEELREAFGLRSACFTLSYSEGVFQFTVHGWGHGVGMSQAGAAFLANQGESYEAILAHYYPGAVLEK